MEVKKKCVNGNGDIQVVEDSNGGKSVLAESGIMGNEDNQDSELALTAATTIIPEDDSLKYCQGFKPTMKSIISRSSLSFKDLTTCHNQYLNHHQLTEKSNNYFQNMRTSRLHVMNMQGKSIG